MTGQLGRLIGAFFFALGLIFLSGCDSEGSDDDEVMISRFGDTESHNSGSNCMSCHRSGGSGEGVFTVAGTVYEQDGITISPGALVNIFSMISSEAMPVMRLEVDVRGNFYTTESLDFRDGLYAEVSAGGDTALMMTPITAGACGSCHGETVSVITVP